MESITPRFRSRDIKDASEAGLFTTSRTLSLVSSPTEVECDEGWRDVLRRAVRLDAVIDANAVDRGTQHLEMYRYMMCHVEANGFA